MAGRLAGRTAIVFGAGSSGPGWGNGKATAVAFAREGAAVACVDIAEAAAAETAQIIAGEGGRALAIAADVTHLASVESAVAATLKALGPMSILHNNVGIANTGAILDIDEAHFTRVLDINIGSVFRTAKAVLPVFLENGGGAIVNIASLAAIRWVGYPYFAYYASKAAVVQATASLALQYARQNIRANAILPGLIDTPLIYSQISGNYASVEDMVAGRNAAVPMGKMGDAFDVANAAVFLASDEAKFITGVALPVDGGQSCAVPAPR